MHQKQPDKQMDQKISEVLKVAIQVIKDNEYEKHDLKGSWRSEEGGSQKEVLQFKDADWQHSQKNLPKETEFWNEVQ